MRRMEPAQDEDLDVFPMTSSQRQHTPRTLHGDDVSEAATATVVQQAYRAANNASCGGRGSSFRAREMRFPGFHGTADPIRSKIFNDPVHGHIRIPGYCVRWIMCRPSSASLSPPGRPSTFPARSPSMFHRMPISPSPLPDALGPGPFCGCLVCAHDPDWFRSTGRGD